MSEHLTETESRLLDEQAVLREAIDRNANMYRRDVQYALDLMEDVQLGRLSLIEAKNMLRIAHEDGREELRDWRIGLDGNKS